MSTKLKALGVGLLAAMAISGFTVMNASATTGGHFTSDVDHAIIKGFEGPGAVHKLEFSIAGLTPIVCEEAAYHGTVPLGVTTVEHVTVTPTYGKCLTTGGTPGEVNVTPNGCEYTFKIGKKATTHNTVSVVCPAGKVIEVHHPSCTITVPAQNLNGVVYHTVVEKVNGVNKHAITLASTVGGITSHFHGGICNLLGTTHVGELNGSATVKGFDTAGNQVNITATGSEDPKE